MSTSTRFAITLPIVLTFLSPYALATPMLLSIELNPTGINQDPFGLTSVPENLFATVSFDSADDSNSDPNIINLADGKYQFEFDAGIAAGMEDVWSLNGTVNNSSFSFDLLASTAGNDSYDWFRNASSNDFGLFNSSWTFFDRSRNNAFVGGTYGAFTLTTFSVPEPTTLALMALGLAGIGLKRRKPKQR